MSQENVALFFKASSKDPSLADALSQAPTASDWVALAAEQGFEFTIDELVALIGEILEQEVTAENAAQEYLLASAELEDGELDLRALEAIAGGGKAKRRIVMKPAHVQSIVMPPTHVQSSGPR